MSREGGQARNPGIKILFKELAFEKMYAYAKEAIPNEVGGFGFASIDQGILNVYDIVLLPQTVGPASTTLTPEGIAQYLQQMPHPMSDLRIWWHSHANFGTFFSSTDMKCVQELLKFVPWILTPVVNAKNDLYLAVHMKYPTYHFYDDLEYDVLSPADEASKLAALEVPLYVKEAPRVFEERTSQGMAKSVSLWKDKDYRDWGGGDWVLDSSSSQQDGTESNGEGWGQG
jgi:proteasome lid subunit RPN8/RPN11